VVTSAPVNAFLILLALLVRILGGDGDDEEGHGGEDDGEELLGVMALVVIRL
jgi:hypothetical protein